MNNLTAQQALDMIRAHVCSGAEPRCINATEIERICALVVPPGPQAELLRPVYAPGGVRVTADELLKRMELALDRSGKMAGAEAYNYLYSTGEYTTQVLRKMLAAHPNATI